MTTAANLLREMQSFVSVESSLIAEAEKSGMNEENNSEFADIVEGWGEGRYDDDPNYVVDEISYLLN